MPRINRFEKAGGWYHVMNRGAARRHVFLNDELKLIFLETLSYVAEQYEFKVFSYCIMGNHYHLLLNTPLANLGAGMRTLNSIFAQKFNKLRVKDGPVFRGRYKSLFIENEKYLNNLLRYIHLNPVSACITDHPDDYPWSSHLDYLLPKPRHSFLSRLEWATLENYRNYIDSGNNEKIADIFNKKYWKSILK